jgi:hypothetical protein
MPFANRVRIAKVGIATLNTHFATALIAND